MSRKSTKQWENYWPYTSDELKKCTKPYNLVMTLHKRWIKKKYKTLQLSIDSKQEMNLKKRTKPYN